MKFFIKILLTNSLEYDIIKTMKGEIQMTVVVSIAVLSVMYELLKLTEKILIAKGVPIEEIEEL